MIGCDQARARGESAFNLPSHPENTTQAA